MRLTTFLLTSLLSTSLVLASSKNLSNDTKVEMSIKQEGIKYIKMLGGTLKKQLQTHMEADKTGLSAIGFCSVKAEVITKEINKKLPAYASVRRTALKIRNENNINAIEI